MGRQVDMDGKRRKDASTRRFIHRKGAERRIVDGECALRRSAFLNRHRLHRSVRRCVEIDGLGAGRMVRAKIVFRERDIGRDLIIEGGASAAATLGGAFSRKAAKLDV